eukprot:1415383-Pyramimonas_sp.AAC.1
MFCHLFEGTRPARGYGSYVVAVAAPSPPVFRACPSVWQLCGRRSRPVGLTAMWSPSPPRRRLDPRCFAVV